MCGVGHARTYDLGQAAVVSFDLVRNMLSFDKRGPEEDEGVGRARDMRGILAPVFGVCTSRAQRRRTGRRHDEHCRWRGRTGRERKDWFVIEHWTRFRSEREAHTRVRVVNQRGHII